MMSADPNKNRSAGLHSALQGFQSLPQVVRVDIAVRRNYQQTQFSPASLNPVDSKIPINCVFNKAIY
jgi:hypothetical protein